VYIILIIIIIIELLLSLFFLVNKNIKKENKILILSCLILTITTLLYKSEFLSPKNYMLFLLAIFSLIILKLIFNISEIEKKYNKIIKYVIEYEKIIDDQGERNHEYNNQLMILKGYINNKKKLEEYLNTIINDHKLGQNYEIRQLSHFPNGGLKEMLYYKISEIKDNKIKYYLYVCNDASELLEKMNVNLYRDITKVFGVLIDNAIDASLESEDKEFSLDFSKDKKQIIITISNTYNKDIDIKKIGKKGFSSKGKGHGFGLKLVKDIIKRNKNLELVSDFDDKYFIQTFLIDIE
jgi:two-component system sensor histidine kinase AgrC